MERGVEGVGLRDASGRVESPSGTSENRRREAVPDNFRIARYPLHCDRRNLSSSSKKVVGLENGVGYSLNIW